MIVVTIDVVADRHHEFFEIAKHTAPQSGLSKVAEEAFHHVERRRTGRSEVRVEAGMACLQSLNACASRNCRRSGVSRDGGYGLIEQAQKPEPFLMSMPFLTKPVKLAVGRIESGKQSRGAVAFVVVGHSLAATALQRQTGLRAIQGLDLLFSFAHSTSACSRGFRSRPMISPRFSANSGSLPILELSTR